ncbi:hypothetical protein CSC04_1714 [Enterobacter roggenkampii]|nr:hypothetical protein CSC04_1714 [Enterobacter roggenkampii]
MNEPLVNIMQHPCQNAKQNINTLKCMLFIRLTRSLSVE